MLLSWKRPPRASLDSLGRFAEMLIDLGICMMLAVAFAALAAQRGTLGTSFGQLSSKKTLRDLNDMTIKSGVRDKDAHALLQQHINVLERRLASAASSEQLHPFPPMGGGYGEAGTRACGFLWPCILR